MARQESDREDLLAEATALVERVEFALPGQAELVIAGFRRTGCGSLFFGPDLVYQFNTKLELRRAFVAGLLYTADAGWLASLERRSGTGGIELVRRDLMADQQAQFLARMAVQLAELRRALAAGQGQVVRQVPAGADLLGRVRQWLESLAALPPVAQLPHAV